MMKSFRTPLDCLHLLFSGCLTDLGWAQKVMDWPIPVPRFLIGIPPHSILNYLKIVPHLKNSVTRRDPWDLKIQLTTSIEFVAVDTHGNAIKDLLRWCDDIQGFLRWTLKIIALCCSPVRHFRGLEQQERDPSPPSVTFGSASHPVLSHAPLRACRAALGLASCPRAAFVVSGTSGVRSARQSAEVQFVLEMVESAGFSLEGGTRCRSLWNNISLGHSHRARGRFVLELTNEAKKEQEAFAWWPPIELCFCVFLVSVGRGSECGSLG